MLEGDLPTVPIPPRVLLTDPLQQVAGDQRAIGTDAFEHGFDELTLVDGKTIEGRPSFGAGHVPAQVGVQVDRDVRRLVHPVLKQLGVCGGIPDQRPRMHTETGKQDEFLAAGEHVDRVDLDQPSPIDQVAEVSTVDTAGRSRPSKSLCSQRDLPRVTP